MTRTASRARLWTIAGAALVLAGIVLRLRLFYSNPALWLDECSVALNILSRSFGELAKPLDYNQGAPLLFLWLQKLIVSITGSSSEYALRSVPFLCGAASCAGFWLLCRRFRLNGPGTVCATALFSFSVPLILNSNQVKPYSVDVFFAIAIYLAALRFQACASRRDSLVYLLIGLVAIGFSYPAVFVLAATGSVGLIDAWRRNDRRKMMLQAAIASVWALGFGLDFFLVLRHLNHIPGMIAYWEREYSAFMPFSSQTPVWLLQRVTAMTGFKTSLSLPLEAIGVVVLFRRDWRAAAMLAIPAGLAALASAAQQYPYAERMILFLVPANLIFAGASLPARLPVVKWRLQPALLAVFCLILLLAARRPAVGPVYGHQFKEDFPGAFLDVVGDGRCAGHILIYESAASNFRYYNRYRWNRRYTASIVTASQLTGAPGIHSWMHYTRDSDSDVAAFSGPPCFWLVYSHTSSEDLALLTASLQVRGYEQTARRERTKATGRVDRAGALLFTLR